MIIYNTNGSIRTQVITIAMAISLLALVVVTTVLFTNDLIRKKNNLVNSIVGIGQVISLNSTAALAFKDPENAKEILSALSHHPDIVRATIFDSNLNIFAYYTSLLQNHQQLLSQYPAKPLDLELSEIKKDQVTNGIMFVFQGDLLKTQLPIVLNGQLLGHLVIDTNLAAFKGQILFLIKLTVAVFFGGLFLAYGLANLLQNLVSLPILNLTHTIQRISKEMDYNVRANVIGGREVRMLSQGFNEMLQQISLRDQALEKTVNALDKAKDQAIKINKELQYNEQRLRYAQKIAGLGDWAWDYKNKFLNLSPEVYELHGLDATSHQVKNLNQLFAYVRNTERDPCTHKINEAYLNQESYEVEYCVQVPNQKERYIIAKGAVEKDKFGKVKRLTGTFQDITQRKQAEIKIMSLAYYDTLTQLPNRQLFHDRLRASIERARSLSKKIAVLFIDLDNFKKVNDTLGHDVGDKLLKVVAQELRNSLPKKSSATWQPTDAAQPTIETDQIARLGGDEFVVLLTHVDSKKDAEDVARSIIKNVSVPVKLDNSELLVTSSIGISIFPDDGENGVVLLKNADAAMYRAKAKGRDNFQFYSANMTQQAVERLNIESALRMAISNNELEVHYQPLWCVNKQQVSGFEALLRWSNPRLGEISPEYFIAVAEESGLIGKIGEWVLDQSCKQMEEWYQDGFKNLNVSVNLSMSQFNDTNMLKTIKSILGKYRIPRSMLTLELTESVLMSSCDEVITRLKAIKELGIHLAIDDFGTGYSSLSYLKLFPIDILKIDRSFIKDINNDPNDEAIIQAIIVMAHQLGLKVVAEGVENDGQKNFLMKCSCDILQGNLIAKPTIAYNVRRFLEIPKPFS